MSKFVVRKRIIIVIRVFFLFLKFDIKNLAKLSNKIAKLIEFSLEKQKIKTFSQFVLKKQLRLEKITLMWL
jgi:hypothetical protein